MNENTLHIDFLKGTTKDDFDLNLLTHFSTESGGRPWENTYSLVINDEFFEFWKYVREKYGVDTTTQKVVSFEEIKPVSATISQKTRGVDKDKGYPWVNKLEVKDENRVEYIVFHPYTCDLLENVMKEEESSEKL